MTTIYVNRRIDEPDRRQRLFAGDFFLYTDVAESHAIVGWAKQLIGEAFGDLDPQHAQHKLDVEEFVKRVGEIRRSGPASISHSAWQLLPSPLDDVNTVASAAGSAPAWAQAASATAMASLIARPARRRSAAGSRCGAGTTVACG